MYTLKSIVKEWIAENGKSEAQLARFYTIAVSGLRELNIDVNGIVKIVQLSINDNDTVDLPNDFINYSKIGIVGSDGRIHCLGRDNSINLNPSYNDCGTQVSNPNTTGIDYPFYGLPFAGCFYGLLDGSGAQFGIGGGNNNIGYYRLDRANNRLVLANMNILSGTSLIMEYVSDIESGEDGDFILHPYFIQTIKSWISWRYVIGDRNTNGGEKEMRRREYFNSFRIAKARYGNSTIEEWLSCLRAANTGSVRF